MQKVMQSVAGADVAGKRVLVRADFDVPLKDGAVADDSRIRACIPTIKLLQEKGAVRIVLMAHLGRPGGEVVESLRMAPVRARLQELVDMTHVELLENLRFDPREEANDPTFAKELAAQGDVYVNEAFAAAHRAHASTVGVPKLLPHLAGLRLCEEVERLSRALTPPSGALAIIGGAKFETKQPLLEKLVELYKEILLGGALASDVLKARGMPVGASLVSESPVPVPLAVDERIVVPNEVVVQAPEGTRTARITDVRANEMIVDLGPSNAAAWAANIATATFILWNGPLGVYEKGQVAGTDALAQAVAASAAPAVLGGGDTAAALTQFNFDPVRVFISTGGGAMLEFLANAGSLPALDALRG